MARTFFHSLIFHIQKPNPDFPLVAATPQGGVAVLIIECKIGITIDNLNEALARIDCRR
jgi:hypothetical protein